jgi:hypothetical protein
VKPLLDCVLGIQLGLAELAEAFLDLQGDRIGLVAGSTPRSRPRGCRLGRRHPANLCNGYADAPVT